MNIPSSRAEPAVLWSRPDNTVPNTTSSRELQAPTTSAHAAWNSVAGLILQSTFTSIPDLGRELYPWLPIRWISSIKYDNRAKLPGITVPTNGTVLVQPGLPPEDLQPGIAVQLIPGAVIDLGDGVTVQVTNP